MRSFPGSIVTAVAMFATLIWTSAPGAAQDFDGSKAAAAMARKDVKPAPRLPNGRPDFGNGKGSWSPPGVGDMAGTGGGYAGTAKPEKIVDVPFQPWAKIVYAERNNNETKDDPEASCLPPGIPRMYATAFPFQIYQMPDRIMFVFEGAAHMWRVVYTDGRSHTPADQWNPTYLGEGIGHWEGDTLVVDVRGFNDRSWLDAAGHPHTEALHIVERFTRVNELVMHYEALIDDPGAYTKPWTTSWNIVWDPGIEPYEYICQEGNKDLQHLVGK